MPLHHMKAALRQKPIPILVGSMSFRVYSWLQNTVEASTIIEQDRLLCYVGRFGGAHSAFRLFITCAVRRYGFLLRTLPPYICRPHLATTDRAFRAVVFRILGLSQDVHTLDQPNCAKRQLYLPAEFGGLNVPSLELDNEHAHYASFTATLANVITDNESESLGSMYGLIRHELLHVATFT
jgi:hypothetical protein